MRVVYLDHAASTQVDPRVIATVVDHLRSHAGNPGNTSHAAGRAAAETLATARSRIASAIHASPTQIVLTGSATEANNLAILGTSYEARPRVVVSPTEHASVIGPVRYLATRRVEVACPGVDRYGRLDLDTLAALLDQPTALVAAMWVNNETGTIHDVAAIGALARARGVVYHCDASQALGRLEVDVRTVELDSLTLSAHKFGGPPGIGALYVRDPARLAPRSFGGGQEQGLRPSTPAVALAAGFGVACELVVAERLDRARALAKGTAVLRRALAVIPGAQILSPADAAPGILSISFAGVATEDLRCLLDDVALGSGAACSSGGRAKSHVLTAQQLPDETIAGALRLSLSPTTSTADLEFATERLACAVHTLRSLSRPRPLFHESRPTEGSR